MSITKRLKGTQKMKTLQTNLKTMQTNKQERQTQLEPLQEQATQMISQLEEEKMSMAQAQSEGTTLLQEEIITQTFEALTNKAAQMRVKGKELEEKFHSLEKVVHGASTTRVARDELDVSVGGLLGACLL
jgi:hypothetical protein